MDQWIEEEEKAEEARQRRKARRRVVLGGLAGVMLLAATAIFANSAISGDSGGDVEAAGETATERISWRRDPFDADSVRAAAMRTTTTTAPTTTAPPPPPTTTTTTEAPPPPTTEAPVEQADTAADSGGAVPDPYSHATWDQLAGCESGGNWSINTGNGYYGGLQFSLSSWQAVGGSGYPHENSRETQITMGIRLYESQGWGAWPACTASFGWR